MTRWIRLPNSIGLFKVDSTRQKTGLVRRPFVFLSSAPAKIEQRTRGYVASYATLQERRTKCAYTSSVPSARVRPVVVRAPSSGRTASLADKRPNVRSHQVPARGVDAARRSVEKKFTSRKTSAV
jgi:hypothetical protein